MTCPPAITLLQERAKYDHDSKLVYSLAALEGSVGRADDAVRDLATAAEAADGTNALQSAQVDTRFAPIARDARFQSLVSATSSAAAAQAAARTVLAGTNSLAPPVEPTIGGPAHVPKVKGPTAPAKK